MNDKKLNNLFYLFASLFFLLLSVYLSKRADKLDSADETAKRVSEVFHNKFEYLKKSSDNILNEIITIKKENLFEHYRNKDYDLWERKGIYFALYKNNKLVYWNSSEIPEINLGNIPNQPDVSKLSNGWYITLKKHKNNYEILCYSLIKTEYVIKNNYLEEYFQSDYNLPSGYTIVKSNINKECIRISDVSNDVWLYLIPPVNFSQRPIKTISFIAFLTFLFLFLMLLRNLILEYNYFNKSIRFLFFVTAVLLFRIFTINSALFDFIRNIDLFNPAIYALSGYIPSTADLIINLLFLFFIAKELLYSGIRIFNPTNFNSVYSIIVFGFIHFIAISVSQITKSLVRDSTINFDVSNFYNLNNFSLIGIFATAIVFFTFHTLASYLIKQVANSESNRDFVLVTFSTSIFIILILFFTERYNFQTIYYSTAYIFIYWLFEKELLEKEYFTRSILYVLLFSLWSSMVLSSEINTKREQKAIAFSGRITQEKDKTAEFLFIDNYNKILNDDLVKKGFHNNDNESNERLNKLKQKYFSAHSNKYNIKFYVYDTLCNLLVKSTNAENKSHDYFEKIYTNSENRSEIPNLYYHKSNKVSGKNLVATFKINPQWHKKKEQQSLFIEFESELNNKDIGYPSLLLDKNFSVSDEYIDYSYGKFVNNKYIPGKLFSDFKYNTTTDFFKALNVKNDEFFNFKNYKHYLTIPDKNTAYVVSFKQLGFWQKMNFAAYLFLFYSLSFLLFVVIRGNASYLIKNFKVLNVRIRTVVITSVFITLTAFTIAIMLYFQNYFKKESRIKLSATLHNMMTDINNTFGEYRELNVSNSIYFNYLLSNLNNIFDTEINIYDTSGKISASSRYNIFEQGILSPVMHPQAYKKMNVDDYSEFINTEKIGLLEYISVYVPLYNFSNKLIGYIQLPFFNHEQEYKKEILNMVVTIVNIYVLLFVLSALFSIWLANRITLPLKILQQKFSSMQLGKSPDTIPYKSEDEIGSLISEYNRMVLALNDSVNELTKAEREGAWREMAKQVAHEIKNPLTPMKLNVQYLQKTIENNEEEWKEKFSKISSTLIEQIETLNNIANEFSSLAILPKSNFSELNISEVVESVVQFFKNNSNCKMELIDKTNKNCKVMADKDQLIRVFNNLIKNSIQATESVEDAFVSIVISRDDKMVSVQVKDNGVGIDTKDKEKIFRPNFTTKTSGSGLGLAMVKNIVETSGGAVRFESERNKGAEFYVYLPII